jgi:hypothetical protein
LDRLFDSLPHTANLFKFGFVKVTTLGNLAPQSTCWIGCRWCCRGEYGSHIDEYHGWTDGSRRVSAAFGWSLRGYNDQGKEVELDCNKVSLGQFETAFDGEMEAIADIMEYAIDDQIPGDLCDNPYVTYIIFIT